MIARLVGWLGRLRHAQFLHLSVVPDLLDTIQSTKGREATVAADPKRVMTICLLDGLKRAVQHLSAFEDHENEVTHLLGNTHVVGAEYDSCSPGLKPKHRLSKDVRVHRIKTCEWLIEYEQVRFGNHSPYELHLLTHSLAQGLDLLIRPLG